MAYFVVSVRATIEQTLLIEADNKQAAIKALRDGGDGDGKNCLHTEIINRHWSTARAFEDIKP